MKPQLISNDENPSAQAPKHAALPGVPRNTTAASTIPTNAAFICFRMISPFLLSRRGRDFLTDVKGRATARLEFLALRPSKQFQRKCKLVEAKRGPVPEQVEQSIGRRQSIERAGVKLILCQGLAARVCNQKISRAVD